MDTVLVLSADKWEMTDEKTGVIRNGVTIQYVNDYRENDERSVGLKPTKAPASLEVFESIRKGGAPALYRLDFRTRPGKESKPTLTVIKAEIGKAIKIFDKV